MRVHTGFARALESVLLPLQTELRKSAVGAGPGSRKPIFVTGHSLGGALATLAAYRLQRAGFPVRAVYLHAAPKVGDAAFSAEYASRRIPTFRTEHWRDLVPTLPSAPLTGAANRALLAASPVTQAVAGRGYTSDTAQRGYTGNGRILTNPSPRTVEQDRGGRLTFADHSNFLYALKLYNALTRRERAGLPAPR